MFKGVILTDSVRLSETLHTTPQEIGKSIQGFIAQCDSFIEWYLVDVSDEMYRNDIDSQDWHTHAQVLEDYYYGLELNKVENCPLFIIGGDNDIPMPQIYNPMRCCGKEYLDTDMLYCFSKGTEDKPINIITERPRFVPGRLPFCDEHNLDDLKFYLENCVQNLLNGIDAHGVIMTTTESWIPASTTMMQDIPTPILSSDYVPLNNRMVVSPLLDTEYSDMYEGYVHELKKSNFLVCNLHGNDAEDCPYFIGENKEHTIYTLAVQPSMLNQAAPAVFNTIACFGGRFIGYEIDHSMLYSALINGTMIFTGACDIALGGPDGAGYSELLMKLFDIYLLQGKPAGLALMQAKRHYYNTCHMDEEYYAAMYTIMEFNLYGCPILNVIPMLNQNYAPSLLGHRLQLKGIPVYEPIKFISAIDSAYKAEDVYAYVRGRVDDNLSKIREKVEAEVYQRLGLKAQNLANVYKKVIKGQQAGWQFIYHKECSKTIHGFSSTFFVNTNEMGEIKNIFQTK